MLVQGTFKSEIPVLSPQGKNDYKYGAVRRSIFFVGKMTTRIFRCFFVTNELSVVPTNKLKN